MKKKASLQICLGFTNILLYRGFVKTIMFIKKKHNMFSAKYTMYRQQNPSLTLKKYSGIICCKLAIKVIQQGKYKTHVNS